MKFSRLKAHLNAAKGYAELSSAIRLKVGAVLVRDDRIISIGYNGMPSGGSNNCEYENNGILKTKPEVIHAEANAILFAAKEGISTKDSMLVLTHSPCFDCARLIIQAGIKEIYYEKEYRLTNSLDYLRKFNVKVHGIN